jgi:hypothetical protein
MVMLKRSWKWIVALCTVSAMLARMREVWQAALHVETEVEAIVPPPDADTTEKELTSSPVVAKATADLAPPPAPSMPIGNRFVHAEPQAHYSRFTPHDDSWWMGTPSVMLLHMAARRMPVGYHSASG